MPETTIFQVGTPVRKKENNFNANNLACMHLMQSYPRMEEANRRMIMDIRSKGKLAILMKYITKNQLTKSSY